MCTELGDTAHHLSALDGRDGRNLQIEDHSTDDVPPAGRTGAGSNPLEETPCGFEPHPGHHL